MVIRIFFKKKLNQTLLALYMGQIPGEVHGEKTQPEEKKKRQRSWIYFGRWCITLLCSAASKNEDIRTGLSLHSPLGQMIWATL